MPISFCAQCVATDHFAQDGRGPGLRRWLLDSDLLLPGSEAGFAPLRGSPVGAQHAPRAARRRLVGARRLVVFHDLQVIQVHTTQRRTP
ncbi:MAG TPA: hypothetical protein VFS21_26050 [Roseiflexaceae bacterium]|nr:hypothetical protein [Roseiflexaceae bacterium]